MKFNRIVKGINFIGTTIKSIDVNNNIVDIEKEAKRSFGLNINEPHFEQVSDGCIAQMTIDFEIEIEQTDNEKFRMEMSLEGAFFSTEDEDTFQQLVAVNGAAAIIGIARGKVEAITSNIFNNGKVVIPFVNVIDYYKSLSE